MILLALGATIVGALVALGVVWATGALDQNSGSTRVVQEAKPNTIGANNLDVVAIADKVRPAIVNVQVTSGFGQGSGSGVIYDSSGLIMTNNHVVEGSADIGVELTDGRKLDAQLLGGDAETDIAVLRVDASDLPTATLATATTLEIGEPTVAIGNPLGLQGGPTVTVGYISALGRTLQVGGNSGSLVDMIQTDAPIAEGSSGGALLNGSGGVIGITTAIAVSQAGAGDIGFATPIDIAIQVADQLATVGKATHPFMGVRGVDADAAEVAGSGEAQGAMIVEVEPGTPAAQAGLQPDDIVTAVDGKPITSMSGLVVALRSHKAGETVELTVERGGKEETVKITLGEKPS